MGSTPVHFHQMELRPGIMCGHLARFSRLLGARGNHSTEFEKRGSHSWFDFLFLLQSQLCSSLKSWKGLRFQSLC